MKKAIVSTILLMLAPTLAMALPTFTRMKTKLNQNIVPSDGNYFRLGDQLTNKKVQVMKVTYDVSVNGGSIANHALKEVDNTSAKIPDNAVVKEAWIDIRSEVMANSASPVLCFTVESSCDLKAGETTLWYKTGPSAFKKLLPLDGTTVFKTTADRIVYATVAGGALTGGTMNLFIEYFLSD